VGLFPEMQIERCAVLRVFVTILGDWMGEMVADFSSSLQVLLWVQQCVEADQSDWEGVLSTPYNGRVVLLCLIHLPFALSYSAVLLHAVLSMTSQTGLPLGDTQTRPRPLMMQASDDSVEVAFLVRSPTVLAPTFDHGVHAMPSMALQTELQLGDVWPPRAWRSSSRTRHRSSCPKRELIPWRSRLLVGSQ